MGIKCMAGRYAGRGWNICILLACLVVVESVCILFLYELVFILPMIILFYVASAVC
jgi:hypothetical protein